MYSLSARNDAWWAILAQALVIVISLPVILVIWGKYAAGSYFLGGLICVLPNIYLYRRVFAQSGARAAREILKSLYIGELVKIFLTGLFFFGALQIKWLAALWLFVGYIISQLGFWFSPIAWGIFKNKKQTKQTK